MGRMLVDIPIPPKWKRLWDTWDLRCFIVLSLLLQTFLFFAAPLRKRINRIWIIMPLWSAYLLADQAANFAVGLISNSMGNTNGGVNVKKGDRIPVENEDLLAFWAPFLLVHLGGPDTITAFALEDNELWLRHLLVLIFQCVAAVYVFVQSLPHNRLWIPTMLMFMTGIMKYSERTRSLYLASADRFKGSMLTDPDPGPNYEKLMDAYASRKEGNLPTRIQMVPEPDRLAKAKSIDNNAKKGNLTELEVVQYGYLFFNKFKWLVVDMIFSHRERNHSRDFFLNRTAKDAFKVVEVELNFIYEVLFTKLPMVFTIFGGISRFFSLATVCSAIILFIFKDKKAFSDADVTITYGLLFGALVLDMTALIMLLFSDWTIIKLRESLPDDESVESLKKTIITALLKLLTEGRLWDPKDTQQNTNTGPQVPQEISSNPLTRRWSESIFTYNLIYYCLHPRSWLKQGVLNYLGLSGFFDSIRYVKTEKFTTSVRDFIFDELRSKSELADDMEIAKKISSARGDWVLGVEHDWSSLLKYVVDVDYDKILIIWHIATELCYNSDIIDDQDTRNSDKNKVDEDKRNSDKKKVDEDKHNSEPCSRSIDFLPCLLSSARSFARSKQDEVAMESEKIKVNKERRKIAKDLSDYMLYLLIMQPNMMSAVAAGIGEIRFRDTCAEATRFFNELNGGKQSKNLEAINGARSNGLDLKQACKEILRVSTEVQPVTVKDRSKSLLFDGCILAKELMKIEEESQEEKKLDKWLILSKVWVELLCYAASHCRAKTQAAQVSKGGELITIVWLLMTHFGLGDQFQINHHNKREDGRGVFGRGRPSAVTFRPERVKLIVGK